jgi:hypothetical protein
MKDKLGNNANSSKIILHLQHSEDHIIIHFSYIQQVNSFNEDTVAVYQTVVLALNIFVLLTHGDWGRKTKFL